MRHAKRVDGNHAHVRDGIRAAGYPVLDLSGCGDGVPDLAVMIAPCKSVLLEVKDGSKVPSAQKLTDAEQVWFAFNGSISRVVNSLPAALAVIKEFENNHGGRVMNQTKYELLAQCIRSDQLSAQQVQEHMKDQAFATWYAINYPR